MQFTILNDTRVNPDLHAIPKRELQQHRVLRQSGAAISRITSKGNTMITFIKSLFLDPIFVPGERVNYIRGGSIQRTDGYVVGQTRNGVLVEWPREGASLMAATDLAVIG